MHSPTFLVFSPRRRRRERLGDLDDDQDRDRDRDRARRRRLIPRRLRLRLRLWFLLLLLLLLLLLFLLLLLLLLPFRFCSDPDDREIDPDRRPTMGSGGGDPVRKRCAPRDLEDSEFDATKRPFDRLGYRPDGGVDLGPRLAFAPDVATHPPGSTRRADATDRLSPRRRGVRVLARACRSGGDRRRRRLVRGARGRSAALEKAWGLGSRRAPSPRAGPSWVRWGLRPRRAT